jgi:simple sugar transport system permease protein
MRALPRLEPRARTAQWMRIVSPVLAALLTALSGLALFAALGKDPIAAFKVFFFNPVKDLYGVSELFLKATPLLLIALGLAVGFRANVWNIGAEGQYILGAIAGAGVALTFDQRLPAGVLLPLLFIAGALGGMAWAAIPAWLRTRFNANEILVSLMLVYVAQLLVSWLVHGPWKDPQGFNFPQTRMFEAAAVLPQIIEGTRLTHAFPLAIVALAAGHLFLNRSFIGYQLQVVGLAPPAAQHAGFPIRRAIWIGLLSGGAMAGVAGVSEVAGPMGQLTEHVANHYGFAAIIVAFLGRLHPVGILFASLLMALLYLGGEQAQQYLGLPAAVAKVFQGMLLFFLLATDILAQYRIRWGLAPLRPEER